MHALIDEVLVPTYGVIVYQEQVMQIAQKLSGYTLGGADLLRRAMGKKKKEEMDKQRDTFVSGAKARGVEEAKAVEIFELVAQFAKYGFNRSHSAGYGLVCYQTAYLKAHFPAEFLCGLLTADREKTDKVVRTIAEGKAMGVKILPPDINDSDTGFQGRVRLAAGQLEGASRLSRDRQVPASNPLRTGSRARAGRLPRSSRSSRRASPGRFKDLFDFCSRVDARKMNRGVLEALIQCGAFDSTMVGAGVSRAQAFGAIDAALERGRSASKDRERGAGGRCSGMFDAGRKNEPARSEFPDVPPWDLRETCVREKQALGFYISAHPLDRYDLDKFKLTAAGDLAGMDNWAKVRVAGMVEGYREKIFKGNGGPGGKLAFLRSRGQDRARDSAREGERDREHGSDPDLGRAGGGIGVRCGSRSRARMKRGTRDRERPRCCSTRSETLSALLQSETRSVLIRLKAQDTRPRRGEEARDRAAGAARELRGYG